MLASFLSIPLLVSVASAMAIKRQSDVSCSAVHTSYVRIFSNDQAAVPLPTDGANITLFSAPESSGPGFLARSDIGSQYTFLACESEFMGFPSSVTNGNVTTTYGHLVPVDNSGCLSVNLTSSSGSPYLVQNETCSLSDDESQILQYWSLTAQPIRSTNGTLLTLNFLGAAQDGTTYNNSAKLEMLPQLDSIDLETSVTIAAYTKAVILYALRFID